MAVESLRVGAPIALLLIGVAGFVALASRNQAPTRPDNPNPAMLVETVPVEVHSGGIDFEVDGVVVPFREISVAGEVSGRVTFKAEACRAGRYVTRGTPLVEIDRRQYALEVERLDKEREQADVEIDELDVEAQSTASLMEVAEEDLQIQQEQFERIERLVESGATTDAQRDEEKRLVLAARNAMLTLRKELRMLNTRRTRLERGRELAEAKLEQAKLDLSRTEIVAPISGVIIRDDVEEDSYVQPGTTLFAIEDVSAVEVRSNLRMEELEWIWRQPAPESSKDLLRAAGPDASSTIPAIPGLDYRIPPTSATITYQLGGRSFTWSGELTRYDGLGVDEQTRTVPCRVVVADPGAVRINGAAALDSDNGPRALMRGMFVKVRIHARPDVELLRLPERAVRPGNVAWVVRDRKLRIEKVKVARLLDDMVLLEGGGLEADDRIVISPVAVVRDGMLVREQTVE